MRTALDWIPGMANYRIHRMKDSPQENFRWAAHTGGLAVVKPKDYEQGGEEELKGDNPYEIWKRLSASRRPLRPGDLIEQLADDPAAAPRMWIAKYIGFEPAQWFVPAPAPVEAVLATDENPA
ncbi:MAG TPA: hypothetical protein VKX25_05330 [Bryobacteraceae bacterium]|nr:hypothetical protein [Bryobacteraceae bacterium]